MSPLGRSALKETIHILLLASAMCAVLYLYRIYDLRSVVFSYLPWNLLLAWIPLVIIIGLVRFLRSHRWSDWPAITGTLLWLLFLPNSFYLVSDYIHLADVSEQTILYDVVMFTMFVFTGLLLGYSSLYVFHMELRRRLQNDTAWRIVWLVLLLCSFAIYIGRDLRWNSWDVLLSPAGLLFDLSDRFIRFSEYGVMIGTVSIFFALLAGLYYVGWRLMQVLGHLAPRDI